ncbi:hypothetical protein ACK3TF_003441 [Chlorella vulgaris]
MSLADVTSNLRAPIVTKVADKPTVRVHSVEWRKIMAGEPVEINPSAREASGQARNLAATKHAAPLSRAQVGHGYRVMSVDEWSARWKPNEAWPECLQCGSKNSKEHHFTQTWCRGKKKWESECLCLDCHSFSFRSYCDPDFKTPEDVEKERWQALVKGDTSMPVDAI